jgi:NADH-quinone oxidoreductase subunit N
MQYILPLWPAYSEIFLLAMACLILIVDLFLHDDNRGVTYLLTQATLAGCALLTWFNASSEPVHTFSGMFVGDLMSDVLKLITYFGVMAILVYVRDYITLRGMFRGEFFTLTLFATLGLMVMISANNLLTIPA